MEQILNRESWKKGNIEQGKQGKGGRSKGAKKWKDSFNSK